jgi:RimJ/RimL family protein N-acetyltransferase
MGDERDLYEIMSDAQTLRYLEWETLDEDAVRKWLERDAPKDRLEFDRYFYFGVELLASGKLLGLVSFLYRSSEYRD